MTHLIALDIDGTILGYDESLAERTLKAVRGVADAGHRVVLATGRSLVSVIPVAQQFGLETGTVVCSNGAVTAGLTAGGRYELLDEQRFDPRGAVNAVLRELPDALFAVEVVGWGFKMSAPFPENELHGQHEVVGIDEMVREPVTRVVVRCPEEPTERFEDIVHSLGLDEVTFAVGWTSWMDIAPKDVTKASALERLRLEWGIPLEKTLAIGDGMNDLDMLRWAGTGVAMGHAEPAVHAAADLTTDSIDQDGAAIVLENLARFGYPHLS